MREVIGRLQIQPILTGARQTIEGEVHDLMQKTLDQYGAGIQVSQVQLQKVDPPAQVIDAFREVILQAGLMTITRRTRGDDIDAACGQLAGEVQDRTGRRRRWLAREAPSA